MRLYSFDNRGHDWRPGVTPFQTFLFHGEATAPRSRRGVASHDVGDKDMRPMRLTVNGYRLADVFKPDGSSTLVVSDRAARALEPLRRNFLFLPVAFQKVYVFPWSLDGGHEPDPAAEAALASPRGQRLGVSVVLPHNPAAAAALPPYFELVGHNHYTLVKQFPPTHEFFTSYYEGERSESDLAAVSEAMFREYPVTSTGEVIVRGDIFDALEPFVRRPFFGINEFVFPK